jgi:hypothetical protein
MLKCLLTKKYYAWKIPEPDEGDTITPSICALIGMPGELLNTVRVLPPSTILLPIKEFHWYDDKSSLRSDRNPIE